MTEKRESTLPSWHHERIMDWLISKPDARLRDLSAVTGYSISWLSRLINTDIFRKRLRERAGDVDVLLVSEVGTKLSALADVAIERMHDVLTTENDPELIVDAFDKVMKSNGYAPRARAAAGVTLVNNVITADRELLAKAREQLEQRAPVLSPARVPALQISDVAEDAAPDGRADTP